MNTAYLPDAKNNIIYCVSICVLIATRLNTNKMVIFSYYVHMISLTLMPPDTVFAKPNEICFC